MTILIKGMEMPKEGTVLVIDSSGEVWSNTWPTRGYTRVDKAKAVEVPTPHGRLADIDLLLTKILEKYTAHERRSEVKHFACEIKQDMCNLFDNAPTVIEAEE